MAFVPTGIMTQPYMAKLLLASCASFQTLVEVDSEARARDKIAIYEADADKMKVPRATILRSEDWVRSARGKSTSWAVNGSLILSLWMVVPREFGGQPIATLEDEHLYIDHHAGAIMLEMEQTQGTGEPITGKTHIPFQSHGIMDGPYVLTPEERDDNEALNPESSEYQDRPVGHIEIELGLF